MRSRQAVWLVVVAVGLGVVALHQLGVAQLKPTAPSRYVITVSGMT